MITQIQGTITLIIYTATSISVEHSGKLQVICIEGLPTRFLQGIDSRNGLSYDFKIAHLLPINGLRDPFS